tara:strand:- start:51 stop:929 length:879 start_codon:yes stop_codon:yes gene_type:complete
MITIKLQDRLFAHEPSFCHSNNQTNIKISREPIQTGDIVVYTNQNCMYIHPSAKKNIAFICESYELYKNCYEWIKVNHEKFDLILTWNKELLELNPQKFKLQLYGTTWINEKYRQIYEKTKLCSIIASNKKITRGHNLRHQIINKIINNNINIVDFYGARFNNLSYMSTKGYTMEHSGSHESNQKYQALKDYAFTICILSSKSDYEFDEKLIDCFLTGTVPIFWGCPSIDKFFNIKGMLIFDTIEECIEILNNLNINLYNNMQPFIKENFETAKKYTKFKLNEDAILNINLY